VAGRVRGTSAARTVYEGGWAWSWSDRPLQLMAEVVPRLSGLPVRASCTVPTVNPSLDPPSRCS
jgi:hypothetical protein